MFIMVLVPLYLHHVELTIGMVGMLIILTFDTFDNHIKVYIIQVTSKYLSNGQTSLVIILKS